MSGCYPRRKMGMTIQFESHRVELAGIYEMEHDDSAEPLAEPEKVKVVREVFLSLARSKTTDL